MFVISILYENNISFNMRIICGKIFCGSKDNEIYFKKFFNVILKIKYINLIEYDI